VIVQLPDHVIVVLPRFYATSSGGLPIGTPATGIDTLSLFSVTVSSIHPRSGQRRHDHRCRCSHAPADQLDGPYALEGWITHLGDTMPSGHYLAHGAAGCLSCRGARSARGGGGGYRAAARSAFADCRAQPCASLPSICGLLLCLVCAARRYGSVWVAAPADEWWGAAAVVVCYALAAMPAATGRAFE
jgi:hypothetical protein